ncbi:MAG: hypothetical protein ABIH87_04015 [bacterium]
MEIIIKSLVSAIATAIILLIAKIAGPKIAGAIGGIPIVFAVSYILLTMENKNISRDFLIGGIYGSLAAVFFSVILIFFNFYFLKTHWINFVVAYILTFLLVFILIHLTGK